MYLSKLMSGSRTLCLHPSFLHRDVHPVGARYPCAPLTWVQLQHPSRASKGGDCLSPVPAELSVLLCDAGSAFALITKFCKELNSLNERDGAETAETGTGAA